MKATGIVRRIDDLGRIVIPKEIRRTMHIREGDTLEIYTEKDGEVIFKKYSPMGELASFAAQLCDTLAKTSGAAVAVTDRDSVIAAAGTPRREIYEKRVSEGLEEIMESRRIYHRENGGERLPLTTDGARWAEIAAPIVSAGDVTGCVVFLGDDSGAAMGETEYKLAQTAAGFLGSQTES